MEIAMGMISRCLTALGLMPTRRSCIVLGLDGAGKTTIVHRLGFHHDVEVTPTVGLEVKRFARGKLHLTIFDMGGAARHRDLWSYYISNVDAVIFVVDASDKERIDIVRREFTDTVIGHDRINHHHDHHHHGFSDKLQHSSPILVFCNKLDLDNVIEPAEVAKILGLPSLKERNWYLCACSAVTEQGLEQGFQWLIDQLKSLS